MASERDDPAEELEQLLADGPASEAERASRSLAIFNDVSRPLVLFGAGGLGRRTLAGLRRLGREPVAFTDNSQALWGTRVDGIPVLSPPAAADKYACDGIACVTIWRAEGGHAYEATRRFLQDLGWRRVEPFLALYRAHADQFLPYLAAGRSEDVLMSVAALRSAFALLEDSLSRREFVRQLRWRLCCDFAAVAEPTPGCSIVNEYWPADLVTPGRADTVVDCGAFDGDTLDRYVVAFEEFAAWIAFEPDPRNFAALEQRKRSLPGGLARRVRTVPVATGALAGVASFDASGSAASGLVESVDQGCIEVPVVALDDIDMPARVFLLKLDVEGAEEATLRGARRLLREDHPILAVSCYHRQQDLWELPLLVRELCPTARLALRAHAAEAFDLVLYALPDGVAGHASGGR